MAGFSSWADVQTAIDAGRITRNYFYKTVAINPPTYNGEVVTLALATGRPEPGNDWVTDNYRGTSINAGSGGNANSVGSIVFDPVAPMQRYLLSVSVNQTGLTSPSVFTIYDFLAFHAANDFLLSSTGAKSPGVAITLPRFSGADGYLNELWGVVNSTSGNERVTVTSFTAPDGTSGLSSSGSVVFPGSIAPKGQMIQLPLGGAGASSPGISSVQTITVNTSGGGGFSPTIIRPLARMSIKPGAWTYVSFLDSFSLPRIYDDACLMFSVTSAAASRDYFGVIETVYG